MNPHPELLICFLSSAHPPLDKRVYEKEAKSLAFKNYKVIHLAPSSTDLIDDNIIEIRTFRPRTGLSGRLLNLTRLYAAASGLDANVYHCNEVDSLLIGLVLKFRKQSICIFDVHEHYPEEFSEYYAPKFLKPFARLFLTLVIRLLSKLSDHVVLAKPSLISNFKHLPEDRVHLIKNYSRIEIFRNIEDNRNQNKRLKLIHLGLFSRSRGWPQVIEAMAYCVDIDLLVVGNFNDGSEHDFNAQISQLNLEKRVKVVPWLPVHQAIEMVGQCDLGLITFQPNYYNNVHALPHKLFDYMGMGLPVIAPEFAVEVSRIIEENDCGFLVDTTDSNAIAGVLDEASKNKERLKTLGENARKAVMQHYNWENEEKVLLNLYKKISMSGKTSRKSDYT